jgi:hypothetical protein
MTRRPPARAPGRSGSTTRSCRLKRVERPSA